MKAIIVSHSYLSKENRKNLDALGKKMDLKVLSPSRMKDTIHEYNFQQERVKCKEWTIEFRKKRRILRNTTGFVLKNLKSCICSFNPDLINIEYDIWAPISVQTVLISKCKCNSKLVFTIKKNTYDTNKTIKYKVKDLIGCTVERAVDHYISVSSGVDEIYKNRFGVRDEKLTRSTHLGVDTSLFSQRSSGLEGFDGLPNEESNFLVGYTGRLDREKGVTDLLSGIRMARKKSGLNLHLALLGTGELDAWLRQKSDGFPWLHVHAPVAHERVPKFLNLLDLFVLPSRIEQNHEEHDAHSLLEALSCSVPCIGTSSGVIPEILEGVGPVVSPECPEELGRKIVSLAESRQKREDISEDGRDVVLRKYSLEAVAEKKYEVFEKVLNG